MTDLAALYAAILADPSCDTVRLIYADALEENGLAERAEFIRLQIAYALGTAGITSAHRHDELLHAHREDWLGCGKCRACNGTGKEYVEYSGHYERSRCEVCHGTGAACWPLVQVGGPAERRRGEPVPSRARRIDATFSRGFIGAIECTWETLSQPGAAVAIWAHHPVESVTLSGFAPRLYTYANGTTTMDWWFREDDSSTAMDPDDIPKVLFDLLDDFGATSAEDCKEYRDVGHAQASLSAAACAWGKAQAAKYRGEPTPVPASL